MARIDDEILDDVIETAAGIEYYFDQHAAAAAAAVDIRHSVIPPLLSRHCYCLVLAADEYYSIVYGDPLLFAAVADGALMMP